MIQTPLHGPQHGSAARRAVRRTAQVAGLLLLLLACIQAVASDWAYRVRPGDTLWDLAEAHLRPGISWQRLQAHNGIGDPYRLPPGSILRIPAAWLREQPAPATVKALRGQATVVHADGRSEPAAEGARLGPGARLRTAPDASLSLEFADGSRLRLHGDAELVLDRLVRFGRSGMVDTRLRLQRGRVSNEVRPVRGAGGFVILTPQATSSVRGTEFRVDAGGALTRTEVLEGGVQVGAQRGSTLARRGFGVAVDADPSTPLRPVRLLPAPDAASLRAAGDRLPPRLAWAPVEGAAGYRVQVSASPGFDTLLADATVETAEAVLPPLPDGGYHASVRAIDAQGLEGFDAVAAFQVVATPEPPYAMAPAPDGTVRDARPAFAWSRPQGAASYRFELAADPAFADVLARADALDATAYTPPEPLQPGRYHWRVGSRDAAGKAGPWGDAMAFELRPLAEAGRIDSAAADDGAVTFRWRAGPPGQRYRFQLSRRADFGRLHVDQVVEGSQITLPRLRPGTWYLRAQAIAEDGYAGPMPAPQSVQVPCRPCAALFGGGALLILLAL